MKCSEAEILLQLAADGELTEREQIALDGHLGECVACRRKEAWFELLAVEFGPASGSISTEELGLADDVVAALQPTAPQLDAKRRAVSVEKKKQKNGLLARAAKAAFKRMIGPVPRAKKVARDPSWMDASLSALQPPPASLEGFRAMRNAVAGPVDGVRLALGRRSRRNRS